MEIIQIYNKKGVLAVARYMFLLIVSKSVQQFNWHETLVNLDLWPTSIKIWDIYFCFLKKHRIPQEVYSEQDGTFGENLQIYWIKFVDVKFSLNNCMHILPCSLYEGLCCVNLLHCTKNHISFLRVFYKDGLAKETTLKCDISYIIGKDGISFSVKYYSFRKENKRRYSQRRILRFDIFCMIGKDNISFFPVRCQGCGSLT